ncbi:hypothetical protein HNQ93_000252 [Hymenobacter luteus]|uniref:Uncharacterized protein n=2 Tax=Hymenobacter TaxID=89966 RepID=A0A7W9SWY9_9BACT|nr:MULTISPECIES: hypothetical protein [Hymenobacter]MBB4600268.1 hypothetical protein [Hymenobacter latericoloratus]MBB6057422.1 hypothetical protein [Hymenobacter luteus]
MTILLEDPPQFRWQTDLDRLLPTIRQPVEELNWVVSNLQCWHLKEFVPTVAAWEAQMEHYYSYTVVSGKTLYDTFVDKNIQVVWGVFCGISGNLPDLSKDEVPYADGNRELWTEPESFQLTASEIEIVCWDSHITWVKFRDESQGDEFLKAFPGGQILRNPIAE